VESSKPSVDSFWARRSGLLATLVILLVSALGFALDILLVKEGTPRRDVMLFTNSVTGVIAGWLFYQFAVNEKHRREIMRERMHTIAELNHHIRNALQVIKFAGGVNPPDAVQLQLINEAVNRIEWALREVLPRYPQGLPAEHEPQPHVFSSKAVDEFLARQQSKPH
jgi:hypothetical protein